MSDIRESRKETRYVLGTSAIGTFGATSVRVIDISHGGIQLEHEESVKVGSASRLGIRLQNRTIELRGQIVWCRLLPNKDPGGKTRYRSGVKLEESPESQALVDLIVGLCQGIPDENSMERKHDKYKKNVKKPVVRAVRLQNVGMDPDRAMLIRQIETRLRASPDEQLQLAGRARGALSIRVESVMHTDMVLAVWEYLNHVISIEEVHEVLKGK